MLAYAHAGAAGPELTALLFRLVDMTPGFKERFTIPTKETALAACLAFPNPQIATQGTFTTR